MLVPVRLPTLLACTVVVLAGCTSSPPPEVSDTPNPTPAVTGTPSAEELSARQRAAQLTSLAPGAFDATYRLQTHGKRPDADVRMRVRGDRFRLDVEQPRSAAVLINGARGVVSCQVDEHQKQRKRSCFLVAKSPRNIPSLFDPQLQRLFRGTTDQIARPHKKLNIQSATPWTAPKPYGTAECFDIRGEGVSRGTYCYLAQRGPLIGLLARAKFPSGSLEMRSARRAVKAGSFQPPVHPTPLPN